MTRVMFLLLPLLMMTVLKGIPNAQARARSSKPNVCRVFAKHPEWYAATSQAESKWGIPVSVQMAIMWTESRFKPTAKNRHSSAYGFAQAINKTWRAYQRSVGTKATRTNFKAATDFIGWYSHQLHRSLGIAKDNAYAVYMAYHEGAGGYKKARHQKNSMIAKLSKRVARDATHYKAQLSTCDVAAGPATPWDNFVNATSKASQNLI